MKYYTINDLKNRFETCPYYEEEERINYQEKRLIEIIRNDFNGKKTYNKKKCWQKEKPMIWGISYLSGEVVPYPQKIERFVRTIKKHSGGRNLIVMNEPYFQNCYFAIEKEYWDKKLDDLKGDTRTKIRAVISASSESTCNDELRHAVEEIFDNFLECLNLKVESLNAFCKSKYSQFFYYTNFYKSPYVEQYLEKPTKLLELLDKQKKILMKGFKPLSQKNPDKFIDDIFNLLSQKIYSNETKIEAIVDRIYAQEHYLIKKFKKIYGEFETVKSKTYELESEIRTETERLLKSNKEIYPGSLLIDHAKNSGLISASFDFCRE